MYISVQAQSMKVMESTVHRERMELLEVQRQSKSYFSMRMENDIYHVLHL